LDSHTSIADYFGYKGAKEDTLNKYEYSPLTRLFEIDRLNTTYDSKQIQEFCEKLDFKKIVPELIIKPIIHPFKDRDCVNVTKKDIILLKKWIKVGGSVWNSVRGSVWDSVGGSVWDSVGDSVRDSVRGSVWNSVRGSVWDSVGGSVWNSVGGSVWDSVGGSVWDSVGGYISSYFNIPKWKYIKHKKGQNPFQPCIDLWEKGLVPSFDGKTWRLHGGKEGKIVYELK